MTPTVAVLTELVAVTVNTLGGVETLIEPVIAPIEVFRTIPTGRLGLTLNESMGPPVEVIVFGVMTTFLV